MQQGDIKELIGDGGLLVVAQWKAKEGEADKIADILRRFLPRAQGEPGVRLFLIGRGKDDPAQFLFYELFADDAAFASHQSSEHFKTFIAAEALPLLADRQRGRGDPAVLRKAMLDRLETPEGRATYAKRKITTEPVFGNIKANLRCRRFSGRGLSAAQSEWRLICSVHNLLKIRRHRVAAI